MRVVCAPDSYKEALTSPEAAAAMGRGVRRACPRAQADLCPIADGGEGTVEALVTARGGTRHRTIVTGPLGGRVEADWGLLPASATHGPTAVLEMAAAAGLMLVPWERRDPLGATTYGVGELVAAALSAGAQRLLIGIGGSATCDGGCGLAQALGVRFLDEHGRELAAPIRAADLPRVARIDGSGLDPRLRDVAVTVACDVDNPLTGDAGAARVFAPQKGADAAGVAQLEQGLTQLASLWARDLGQDVAGEAGAGAAGGLGGGLRAFLGASLASGIGLVLEAVDLADRLEGAALCLTGEGRLDGQSLAGKAVGGVARRAHDKGVPTVALVGSAADDAPPADALGLAGWRVIAPDAAPAESIAQAEVLLERAAEEIARRYLG